MPAYMHDALLAAYLQTAAVTALSDEALEAYGAPWRGAAGQPAFYRQIAQMDLRFTDEVEGRYREVRCPVRLLWGEQDAWVPLARGEQLAALLPDVIFQPVPGSGHLMQEDRPEAIADAARAFLFD